MRQSVLNLVLVHKNPGKICLVVRPLPCMLPQQGKKVDLERGIETQKSRLRHDY